MPRVLEWRRRDRVLADSHRWQELQIGRERDADVAVALEDVEHAEPDGHDELRVRSKEAVESFLRARVGRMLDQDADVAAAGRLRELNIAAQEQLNVDGLVHRQRRRSIARREDDLRLSVQKWRQKVKSVALPLARWRC
jgi:hypothetical protein